MHNPHMQICKEVYGPRLALFEDIRQVWDFDAFVRGYRPPRVDRGLQLQFYLCLEVRDINTVFVRSKSAVAAATPWSEWHQVLPSPESPQPPTLT